MRTDIWERGGAACGLVFFAFIPVLFALAGDRPALGSSAQELLRYTTEERTSIHVYLILWSVAFIPLLWFLCTVLTALQRADDDPSPLYSVGLVGLGLGLVGVFARTTLEAVAAFRPAEYGADTTRLLWDMSYIFQPVFGVGFAVFLTAAALLVFRTRLFPRWFAWLTLVPAATNLVYVGQIAKNDGYFLEEPGFPGLVLWTLVASVLLLRSLRRTTTTRAMEPSGPVPAHTAG